MLIILYRYDTIKDHLNLLSYNTIKADDGTILIAIGKYRFTPGYIQFFILQYAQKLLTNANGNDSVCKHLCISCPAYFTSQQRYIIKQQGI